MLHVNVFTVLLLNFLLVLVETLMVFFGCDMDKQSGQLAVLYTYNTAALTFVAIYTKTSIHSNVVILCTKGIA